MLGDFSITANEYVFIDFLEATILQFLVQFQPCFKCADIAIDLIITYKTSSFQNNVGISTGLSDFHKIIITPMKLTLSQNPLKIITSRCMKNLNKAAF